MSEKKEIKITAAEASRRCLRGEVLAAFEV